jgi:nitric oxide reductase large subunit
MVVANRPWRLVRDLSKVLVATLATAGFFIVNSSAWAISDDLQAWRLLLISLAALGGLGVWLVVAHSLWERPSQSDNPALAKRVNAVTALTLFLGLTFAYGVLYLIVLAATSVVAPDGYMGQSIGHSAGFGDYAAAAWLASSLATVAGAIGSGLESDDEVRETVSRYRPQPGN